MQGELVKIGHPIAASTVWQILHAAGIDPAPPPYRPDLEAVPDHAGPRHSRGRFRPRGHRAAPSHLRSDVRWESSLVEAVTGLRLVPLRFHRTYIVIKHGTRRVYLTGITANPDGAWMAQAARNFLMNLGQHAASVKFLIRGSCRPVHWLLRRRVHGGRHQDSRQPSAGAESERDLRKDDRYPAPGGL